MQTEEKEYHDGKVTLKATVAYEEKNKRAPIVLVFHAFMGKDEFAIDKAKMLAELGYVGCAVDVFGKGKLAKDRKEAIEMMMPFIDDRKMLEKRILASYEFAKNLSLGNPQKMAAIGFCFGGLCALDLARSGADIEGVVSFHGLLSPPQHGSKKILSKVLVLHGHDDPQVPIEQVNKFKEEMTKAQADWQLHAYGNTMHAFTNPNANDPDFGTVYNPVSEKRAFHAMKDFFMEIFH